VTATIKLTDYGNAATPLDVLTTDLNSLAANTGKALSAVVDNGTGLWVWADFELVVTFPSAPTTVFVVELYQLRSIDAGTTYPDGNAGVDPSSTALVGTFPVRGITTAQRVPYYGIPLPPGKSKYLVKNATNAAFASSGNILRLNDYSLQSV
jgi:hypothetical protein